MAQAATIDTRFARDILSTLRELKEQIVSLNEKLEGAPPYGSDEWWAWSEKRAQEDIKAGRYTVLRNKKEVQQFFDSLKTAS